MKQRDLRAYRQYQRDDTGRLVENGDPVSPGQPLARLHPDVSRPDLESA